MNGHLWNEPDLTTTFKPLHHHRASLSCYASASKAPGVPRYYEKERGNGKGTLVNQKGQNTLQTPSYKTGQKAGSTCASSNQVIW